MSNCKACNYEKRTGTVIDGRPSKAFWADLIGVNEASIRRHLKHPQKATERQSGALVALEATGVRILALDIETAPNLAYVWGLWDQNVGLNQLVNSTEMLCFGARWLGDAPEEIIFRSSFHDGKTNMIADLHALLDEADAVMGWNSAGFDSKHMKREMLEAEMLPPSPYKELDLMRVVKSQFRFPSNKLDYVAQRLGVGAKVSHSGFDLWVKCMAGDAEAWEEMKTYQLQDVHLLIDLYAKLEPWMTNSHPNAALVSGKSMACITCGSENVTDKGVAYTGTGTYRKYQCECGRWMRGVKRASTNDLRAI